MVRRMIEPRKLKDKILVGKDFATHHHPVSFQLIMKTVIVIYFVFQLSLELLDYNDS